MDKLENGLEKLADAFKNMEFNVETDAKAVDFRKLKKELPDIDTIGAVAQISVFVDEDQIIKHIGNLATFFVGGYDVSENKLLEDFCQSVQKIGLKPKFKYF